MRYTNMLAYLLTVCFFYSCKDAPLHCDMKAHQDYNIESDDNTRIFFPNIILPEAVAINHLAFSYTHLKDNALGSLDLEIDSLTYTIYDKDDAIIHEGYKAVKIVEGEDAYIIWDGTISGMPHFGNFYFDCSLTWEGDRSLIAKKVSFLSMSCADFKMLLDLELDCDPTQLQWMEYHINQDNHHRGFSPCD